MAKKNKEEKSVSSEVKLLNRIADFISNNKTLLFTLCCIIIAVIVVSVVLNTAFTNSNEKKMLRVSELEKRYNEFSAKSSDDADHYDVYSALINDLNAEINGKSYSSMKASYLMGLTFYSQKHYEQAYDAFMKTYELDSDVYIATISLINAASCKESIGEIDSALDLYKQVSEIKDSGLKDRALFNMGRIYMEKGNKDLAKANFQAIIDMNAVGEYKALAQNILCTL